MGRIRWDSPSDRVHALTWLSWALLFATQMADAWVYQLPWIIWLGRALPLLIFLPGMLKGNLRSYIWLCFVSLLYFIALVERLVAQPSDILAALGMLAVVTMFTAAMLFVRWRAREIKAAASNDEGVIQ
ncbi:MAG: DUF2069 domain-containing protein [Proteobacteria bacterium]|nr:DUF2069 domain-containing protein [Pseudomonadota bacterium]